MILRSNELQINLQPTKKKVINKSASIVSSRTADNNQYQPWSHPHSLPSSFSVGCWPCTFWLPHPLHRVRRFGWDRRRAARGSFRVPASAPLARATATYPFKEPSRLRIRSRTPMSPSCPASGPRDSVLKNTHNRGEVSATWFQLPTVRSAGAPGNTRFMRNSTYPKRWRKIPGRWDSWPSRSWSTTRRPARKTRRPPRLRRSWPREWPRSLPSGAWACILSAAGDGLYWFWRETDSERITDSLRWTTCLRAWAASEYGGLSRRPRLHRKKAATNKRNPNNQDLHRE